MSEDKHTNRIDYGVILSVMLLALFSIAMIYSTTNLMAGEGMRQTIMHTIWYALGTINWLFMDSKIVIGEDSFLWLFLYALTFV